MRFTDYMLEIGLYTKLYQHMDSYEESTVRFIYDKCPVCEKVGKSLACCKCTKNNEKGFLVLHKGKIISNRKRTAGLMYISENLESKLKSFQDLIRKISDYKIKASNQIENYSKTSGIKSDIHYYETCISQLQQIAKHQQHDLQKRRISLQKINRKSASIQQRIATVMNKKSRLRNYIEVEQKRLLDVSTKCNQVKDDLKQQKKKHVALLREYIFPISDVKEAGICLSPEDPYEAEASGDKDKSLQEELDEARRLSFVNGRWIDQQIGSSDALQISVAVSAASAPSDGNYSSYVLWLEENHNFFASDPPLSGGALSSSTEPSLYEPSRKSVLRVSAALGHAAQMVLVTRKILSIHLPHRINYRVFCNPSISPQTFTNSVKLLNCNILSLCLQQGVDVSTLHPLHTLRNLQLLTDKLINCGETEELHVPDIDVLDSMEQTLVLADVFDEDSDEDPDVSDWRFAIESDWHTLEASDFKPSESETLSPYESTTGQSSILSPTSGLVGSAFNWAKGWWTQSTD